MAYPSDLEDLDATRGTSGQPLGTPNHVTHHAAEDRIIEALMAKVGVDSSAVATSLDYLVKNPLSTDPGHKHPASKIVNTPAGSIVATDVQAAINELDAEKEPVRGADDNYVTDAEKTLLGNTSGVNTGDETATTLGSKINAAGAATPNDTDLVATAEAAGLLKKITWTNVKAFLKTYFDSVTTTLTNKRITPRVSTEASSATPTINTDNVDAHSVTALATAITSMTTNLSGTPTNFQKLIIRIKDDGTARAITWGASFEARGVALPTTTVISKVLTVGFIYDTVTSKWGCVASAQEA